MKRSVITLLYLFFIVFALHAQQITIPRIEQMPNFPQPYEMRDWHTIAIQYDSLVFNPDASGQYLPLTTIVDNTNNYPGHPTFGIQSYVGTNSPPGMEAINVIPAVISATLNGIDKSSQYDYNWPLLCEEYFNRRPAENVYLNGPNASSGHDWWYETMPNIFFCQLNELYPHTGDFDYQFITIANRWLEAVKVMGGYNAPWQMPYMNYRAFSLSTMAPLTSGVKQPEAAGAIAWILYNAYAENGQEKYRIGAEWCLEFLSNWNENPSYEIQLPYGVYTAARMNATLGTHYDIEKMLNWCFDVGDLRGWGAIVGTWGGKDISGLIGESRDGFPDYAFNMNGFEHAGALVPMVRYDDRFARAIGKWVLNMANASRLYYSAFLPDNMQDNEDWTTAYDPGSVIAYEALREQTSGPYGTGDAMDGGWAQTNLGLYGSSHAGILGAIIKETNIEGILELDLLSTDYYGTEAYPSYLYYNPFNESKTVIAEVTGGSRDVYDAIANQVIAYNITGTFNLEVPSDHVIMTVLIPAGSNITYALNRAWVHDTIIDFNTGENVSNYPPRIKSLAARDSIVLTNSSHTIYCTAEDHESSILNYLWFVNGDSVAGTDTLLWQVPADSGLYELSCIVEDGPGLTDEASLNIRAVQKINYPPEIISINADPRIININANSELICHAYDANADPLIYEWSAQAGEIIGSDSTAIYIAPAIQGNYYIYCNVIDTEEASDKDSLLVLVKDPALGQTGDLVAWYTFSNSAWDYSGYDHNGFPQNIIYVDDMNDNPASAMNFYDVTSSMTVYNTDLLNFRDGLSVSFWMEITEFYDREAYPISHGNWQNRWKMSIGEQLLRFTINGTDGIIDLDTETSLEGHVWYHVAAIYNGTECQILLNAGLDAVKDYSGLINTTTYDLILGQSLPSQSGFNFKGSIDNLRIYNYGISYDQVKDIYEEEVSLIKDRHAPDIELEIYPNPCHNDTRVRYLINDKRLTICDLYQVSGMKIRRLVNEEKVPGTYELNIDVSDLESGIYFIKLMSGNRSVVKKLIVNK